jgi:hypothetical protein
MSEPPPEVNVPPWHPEGGDDWRVHLYNQERFLSAQAQMTEVLESLLKQQNEIGKISAELNAHLEVLTTTMAESTKANTGMVKNLIKVPVVIVLIGIATGAFYLKYISEHSWLLILAVAFFPYVGDSITAVAKLVRGKNGGT